MKFLFSDLCEYNSFGSTEMHKNLRIFNGFDTYNHNLRVIRKQYYINEILIVRVKKRIAYYLSISEVSIENIKTKYF